MLQHICSIIYTIEYKTINTSSTCISCMMNDKIRTVRGISDDGWKRIRSRSVLSGKSVGELIEDMIDKLDGE